jgi:hypothetical protein
MLCSDIQLYGGVNCVNQLLAPIQTWHGYLLHWQLPIWDAQPHTSLVLPQASPDFIGWILTLPFKLLIVPCTVYVFCVGVVVMLLSIHQLFALGPNNSPW